MYGTGSLLILTIVINRKQFVSIESKTVCEENDTSVIFNKKAMHDQNHCYFIVQNATERCHTLSLVHKLYPFGTIRISDIEDPYLKDYKTKYYLHFTFNLTNARLVCCEHNATLPIITSASQAMFIKSSFNYSDFNPPNALWQNALKMESTLRGIALGLAIERGSDMWDDGTNVTYKPKDWVSLGPSHESTGRLTMMRILQNEKDDFWVTFNEKFWIRNETHVMTEAGEAPVGVLCQQSKPAANIDKACSPNINAIVSNAGGQKIWLSVYTCVIAISVIFATTAVIDSIVHSNL